MGIKQKLLFNQVTWADSVIGNGFAIAKILAAGSLFLALQRWPHSYYTNNLARGATEDDDEPIPLPLSEVRKCAEQGNAAAQWSLADRYYQGREVRKNVAEGLKWHRKVAEQGIADAQCSLGDIYAAGELVPQNNTEAMKWFEWPAEQGDAVAQCHLGRIYWVALNYTEAARWYRQAAQKNIDAALYNLGRIFAEGLGVPQDYTEAAKWYRRAAEQGHAVSQFNLGGFYFVGAGGLPQDNVLAHMWMSLAASRTQSEDKKEFSDTTGGASLLNANKLDS